jgi:hypothetical protein
MKVLTSALIAALAVTAHAANRLQLAPTASPTVTQDPWQCATEKYDDYFNVPKSTGDLVTAISLYADSLIATCVVTGTPPCQYPEKTRWCGIKTAIPASLQSDLSLYGSTASVWWGSHSSAAVSLAEFCPHKWYKASTKQVFGALYLNRTIDFAECYDEVHSAKQTATSGTNSMIPTATTLPQARLPSATGLSSNSATVTASAAAAAKSSASVGAAPRDQIMRGWIFKVVAAMASLM